LSNKLKNAILVLWAINMQKKNYNKYFFFTVFFGLIILAFFVMKPFFIPFLFAAILVYLFNPVYRFFLKLTGIKWFSSLLVCFLIALVIIIPTIVTLSVVVSEVQLVINYFATNPEVAKKNIESFFHIFPSVSFLNFDLVRPINQNSILLALKSFSQGALIILQGAYAGITNFAFEIFIMFFSLFYLFIDGKKLIEKIMTISHLPDKYEKLLFIRLSSVIRATIKGMMLMGIIDGIVGGILFWATGVASPVFFGMLLAVFSSIPPLGAALIWFPVGMVMLLAGHFVSGIMIFLFGILVIGGIMDTIIRPKLIGKDAQMHPLMILFSTLGGVLFFGISGFIIGPIIISFLVALLDIYSSEFKSEYSASAVI
jgi:predicted PurR-regulated permease PerM